LRENYIKEKQNCRKGWRRICAAARKRLCYMVSKDTKGCGNGRYGTKALEKERKIKRGKEGGDEKE